MGKVNPSFTIQAIPCWTEDQSTPFPAARTIKPIARANSVHRIVKPIVCAVLRFMNISDFGSSTDSSLGFVPRRNPSRARVGWSGRISDFKTRIAASRRKCRCCPLTRRGDWLVSSPGNWCRFYKHPRAPAIELDRKAVRRIDCALVPGLCPNVARPINPRPGRLADFICEI